MLGRSSLALRSAVVRPLLSTLLARPSKAGSSTLEASVSTELVAQMWLHCSDQARGD